MSALDTADAMLFFRVFTKRWCAARGLHASFMSQPAIAGADPSGWHLNQSVLETATGRNIFSAEGLSAGLSPTSKAYAEGLRDWLRDLFLLSVPTVNGYQRLGTQHALSPTRVSLSLESRTAMLRVVGSGAGAHIENRIGEPSANPYLNIAAQLFAGLEGLDGGSADGPREGSDTVPQSLREALEAFTAGRAARLLGDPLAACLARLKESEVRRYEAWALQAAPVPGQVTEWEQREYFAAF
jgi:glutamine synthetase